MYGSQTTYGSQSPKSPAPRSAASHHALMGGSANAYQSNAILTASPGKLLLMLFDGAIRFCSQAEEAIAAKDFGARNTNLVKVQDILTELRVTLDYKPDPIFATRMNALYVFYEKELILANLENDAKKVIWVKRHLTELRDTWAQVIKA